MAINTLDAAGIRRRADATLAHMKRTLMGDLEQAAAAIINGDLTCAPVAQPGEARAHLTIPAPEPEPLYEECLATQGPLPSPPTGSDTYRGLLQRARDHIIKITAERDAIKTELGNLNHFFAGPTLSSETGDEHHARLIWWPTEWRVPYIVGEIGSRTLANWSAPPLTTPAPSDDQAREIAALKAENQRLSVLHRDAEDRARRIRHDLLRTPTIAGVLSRRGNVNYMIPVISVTSTLDGLEIVVSDIPAPAPPSPPPETRAFPSRALSRPAQQTGVRTP